MGEERGVSWETGKVLQGGVAGGGRGGWYCGGVFSLFDPRAADFASAVHLF